MLLAARAQILETTGKPVEESLPDFAVATMCRNH